MNNTRIIRPLIVTICILLIPLIAMQFTSEVQWSPSDFAIMGMLLLVTGLGFEYLTSRKEAPAYKIAAGLSILTAFLLTWGNMAVGLIGDDNPANTLYLGLPLILIVGATLAQLKPEGMSTTLYTLAVMQALIPVMALLFWKADFAPGVMHVLMLNAFFVASWVVSGSLFRSASVSR